MVVVDFDSSGEIAPHALRDSSQPAAPYLQICTPDIEAEARGTRERRAGLICPWSLAAMPDVHAGIGAEVGLVIPTGAGRSCPRGLFDIVARV